MNWKAFFAMLARDAHVARRNLVALLFQTFLQPPPHLRIEAEPGLSDIAFHHFNLLAKEIGQSGAVALEQRIEHWGFFHHLLEAALRRIRLLPPDQQVNPLHLRQV